MTSKYCVGDAVKLYRDIHLDVTGARNNSHTMVKDQLNMNHNMVQDFVIHMNPPHSPSISIKVEIEEDDVLINVVDIVTWRPQSPPVVRSGIISVQWGE